MPTCPVCHGQYALTELDCPSHTVSDRNTDRDLFCKTCYCPRCHEDIYSWRRREEDKIGTEKAKSILKRSYPLVMPLLAILPWITGQAPHWVGNLLAIILSLVAFLLLGNKAPAFRINKWAKPFREKPGLSLEVLELGSFVVGLAIGLVTLVLMKYWILPPAEPQFMEKLITSLTYSFFFILITVALTGMMVNSQVRQLDRIMPQPVFTNTTRLLNIVVDSAKKQLNPRYDLKIETIERTGDAGIQVAISLKQREGKAHWVIKGDLWGRIRSIDIQDWWSFVE